MLTLLFLSWLCLSQSGCWMEDCFYLECQQTPKVSRTFFLYFFFRSLWNLACFIFFSTNEFQLKSKSLQHWWGERLYEFLQHYRERCLLGWTHCVFRCSPSPWWKECEWRHEVGVWNSHSHTHTHSHTSCCECTGVCWAIRGVERLKIHVHASTRRTPNVPWLRKHCLSSNTHTHTLSIHTHSSFLPAEWGNCA